MQGKVTVKIVCPHKPDAFGPKGAPQSKGLGYVRGMCHNCRTRDDVLKNPEGRKIVANRYAKKYRRVFRKELESDRKERKLRVLSHYSGGTPKCKDPYSLHSVTVKNVTVLTIDHILSKNKAGHVRGPNDMSNLYQWLVTNDFPLGYQVLCRNCQNYKVYVEEERYRNRITSKYNTKYYWKLKIEIVKAYGGKCVGSECLQDKSCSAPSTLSVDHIYSDGYKMENGVRGGTQLYLWLRRNSYPSGFQVLCANCQWCKRMSTDIVAQSITNMFSSGHTMKDELKYITELCVKENVVSTKELKGLIKNLFSYTKRQVEYLISAMSREERKVLNINNQLVFEGFLPSEVAV